MEKKQLKPQWQRKSKLTASINTIVEEVAEESKFRREDVKIVITEFLKNLREKIVTKHTVTLPTIGILYPAIKPSRPGMSLNGGVGKPTRVIVPDIWRLRFQTTTSLEKELGLAVITPQEMSEIYRD